jgi:hypothetical protein
MMLALFAATALLGLVLVLRWERQRFLARGLGRSWLSVRLCTIPMVLITAALVVIPARNTSGMEGLAVFYLMLLTAAPLVWFGAHWAVGRFVKPPLSFGDSARIAASPLIYVLAVALVAAPLQSIAWSMLRSLGLD